MQFDKNKDGKYTAIQLVTKFFGSNLQEMKELPMKDRNELASGIARAQGFSQADLSFELVAY